MRGRDERRRDWWYAQKQRTERERSDVEEEDVRDVTGKDTTLDGGTYSDSLIGVDTLAGLAAEDRLDGLDDTRHAAHTTDEDDLVDLARLDTSVVEGLLAGVDGALNKRSSQALELRTHDLEVDVLGAGRVRGDEGKVDLGLRRRRQLDLRLLRRLTDTLNGDGVALDGKTALLLELLEDVLDENDVEVLTTEVSVTVGGLDLEHTLLHLQNGDIEGTTTEIVDSDDGVVGAVETVSEGGGGGLVDDTENVQTSDGTRILRRLPLRVVEVRRDSNDRMAESKVSSRVRTRT